MQNVWHCLKRAKHQVTKYLTWTRPMLTMVAEDHRRAVVRGEKWKIAVGVPPTPEVFSDSLPESWFSKSTCSWLQRAPVKRNTKLYVNVNLSISWNNNTCHVKQVTKGLTSDGFHPDSSSKLPVLCKRIFLKTKMLKFSTRFFFWVLRIPYWLNYWRGSCQRNEHSIYSQLYLG